METINEVWPLVLQIAGIVTVAAGGAGVFASWAVNRLKAVFPQLTGGWAWVVSKLALVLFAALTLIASGAITPEIFAESGAIVSIATMILGWLANEGFFEANKPKALR